jgi:lipopolysaccharide transport system ATP-binding protein
VRTIIRFEHVSKQYKLGLTRTSLPTIVSSWLKRSLNRPAQKPAEDMTFWALRDVSFELEQGDSLALVGTNGAGKTTILKLLANITKPTSGWLETKGKLSALIELGAGFHPDLSGRENIYLNGTILGLSRKEIASRFDEIVAFSELERFIDTPVKRYSSGMIVRLGFAVASCIEPEILLVDEVLAVGDAAFQQKCLKRIRSLINNGTTIIFVSHNFYLVQAVCNSALYLHKGQVKQQGAVKDIIDLYEQDLHQDRARRFGTSATQIEGDEDDPVEVTRVEIGNGDGSETEVLLSYQSAQIQIHYNAYQSLGKVQVSVFIIRSDGLTCCMMRTKLDGLDLFVERGQGLISVQLKPLQLVSGTYYAEAWFLNESDSMAIISKAGRSGWFTVKGAALSYEESSGIFEPITRWNHSQNGKLAGEDGLGKQISDSVRLTTVQASNNSTR